MQSLAGDIFQSKKAMTLLYFWTNKQRRLDFRWGKECMLVWGGYVKKWLSSSHLSNIQRNDDRLWGPQHLQRSISLNLHLVKPNCWCWSRNTSVETLEIKIEWSCWSYSVSSYVPIKLTIVLNKSERKSYGPVHLFIATYSFKRA